MAKETTLTFRLSGKDYKIASAEESHATLRAAAELLESRLQAIAASVKGSGERLAMMAALDLAHEIVTSSQAISASSDAGANSPTNSHTNENLQRTIDSIEARINVALEQI